MYHYSLLLSYTPPDKAYLDFYSYTGYSIDILCTSLIYLAFLDIFKPPSTAFYPLSALYPQSSFSHLPFNPIRVFTVRIFASVRIHIRVFKAVISMRNQLGICRPNVAEIFRNFSRQIYVPKMHLYKIFYKEKF